MTSYVIKQSQFRLGVNGGWQLFRVDDSTSRPSPKNGMLCQFGCSHATPNEAWDCDHAKEAKAVDTYNAREKAKRRLEELNELVDRQKERLADLGPDGEAPASLVKKRDHVTSVTYGAGGGSGSFATITLDEALAELNAKDAAIVEDVSAEMKGKPRFDGDDLPETGMRATDLIVAPDLVDTARQLLVSAEMKGKPRFEVDSDLLPGHWYLKVETVPLSSVEG